MATGYYTFAQADFSVNPAGAKTDLTIKHTDGGLSQVDVDLQSGGSITQLPISGRLSLTGINFDSETVFAIYNGDTLTMTNSVVGGIRNFGGNAVMQGTNALTLGGGNDWAYGVVGSSVLNIYTVSILNLVTQPPLGPNVRVGWVRHEDRTEK